MSMKSFTYKYAFMRNQVAPRIADIALDNFYLEELWLS